ncbi:hypothetical protein LTR70_008820 [Exophiala xenobiotica]|uniref:Uncharacterized protein n=1 Tax=Lithohypha guttulata TaxID=1690604 RepID=A0ABR0JYC2_9EURO|nr:hypothetical protein LTR24_008970 [Lithohypha guttulata]KAK5311398.1 hypothetical protein LTR70_008820 [Exophiala xenobiotica]
MTSTISTASEDSKPFRFFDLPLELQRQILAKHYKGPWTVRVWRDFDRLRLLYWSTLPRSPLLVSRRFSLEAKLAIAESQGEMVDMEGYMFDTKLAECLCEDIFKNRQCWDPAITSITANTGRSLGDMGIREIKDRFTNLTKFTARFVIDLDLGQSIVGAGLLSVLQGELDSQIAPMAHRACCRRGKLPKHQLDLCGVTILFSTCTKIGNNWVEPWLIENVFAEQDLVLDFEITEGGCGVTKKRLSQWDGHKQRWVLGTKLARAIEILQADDEKH